MYTLIIAGVTLDVSYPVITVENYICYVIIVYYCFYCVILEFLDDQYVHDRASSHLNLLRGRIEKIIVCLFH